MLFSVDCLKRCDLTMATPAFVVVPCHISSHSCPGSTVLPSEPRLVRGPAEESTSVMTIIESSASLSK